MSKRKIFAICGSTRKDSSNHHILKAIEKLTTDFFEIDFFEDIASLPHFNPDDNNDNVSNPVKDFRNRIRNADAVIISTPEYAHGVPGSLKNAIDWTVSTNEFSQKPTALITGASDGKFAHSALLETLRVIEAKKVEELNLLISFVRTKVNAKSEITDEGTTAALQSLLEKLLEVINETHYQPRIEALSQKILAGMHLSMSMADNKTEELWRSFMPKRKKITNAVTNNLFSLQQYDPVMSFTNFDAHAVFEKWAAVEVSGSSNLPDGMETLQLPGGLYAVFRHKGAASAGAAAFKYIFGTWLPGSEYELDNRPHFEILGEKYKNDDPESEEEIWIPVRKK
jgi:NAD(P)H-dependent FMN reductase/predicted transcriptional regulator YdeE